MFKQNQADLDNQISISMMAKNNIPSRQSNQMLATNNEAVSRSLTLGMMMDGGMSQGGIDYSRYNQVQLLTNQIQQQLEMSQKQQEQSDVPLAVKRVPLEFAYDAVSQLDCGVLHYLGTLGYSQPWANPDNYRKQVRSFSSSLYRGRPSDILGLQAQNTFCET